MAKKKRARDSAWSEAKRRCRLNAETLRMAKELGLNPRSLIKNIPSKAEPWKAPVHVWVREMYERRRSGASEKRAAKGKDGKRHPNESARGGMEPSPDGVGPSQIIPASPAKPRDGFIPRDRGARFQDQSPISLSEEGPPDDSGEDTFWDLEGGGRFDETAPAEETTAEENRLLVRRRNDFRLAADRIAEALSAIPSVRRVVLFGSVAAPLEKEVPRFREFRRAGIALWHECKDIDLIVWVANLDNLKVLQRARSQALNDLLRDMDVGARPFLQQHEGFTLLSDALAPERTVVLYDRDREWGGETGEEDLPF
ncbi:MAG: hypothetical protein Q8R92_08135 [Deltaproteobacteria bacterium]|nr:hypothetical protein [Deltaproteobacteria bacterium]